MTTETSKKASPATASPVSPVSVDSPWRKRARRLALWAIAIELVGFVLYLVVLLLGETSRFTMIALYLPRQPLLVVAVAGAILAPFTRWRTSGGGRITGARFLAGLHVALAFFVLFSIMGFSL